MLYKGAMPRYLQMALRTTFAMPHAQWSIGFMTLRPALTVRRLSYLSSDSHVSQGCHLRVSLTPSVQSLLGEPTQIVHDYLGCPHTAAPPTSVLSPSTANSTTSVPPACAGSSLSADEVVVMPRASLEGVCGCPAQVARPP